MRKNRGSKELIVHIFRTIEIETGTITKDMSNAIYIELPKFGKLLAALKTRQDKWLFIPKNLSKLKGIPLILAKDKIFKKVFEMARITKLNKKEMNAYQLALKDYRDHVNIMGYAEERVRKINNYL